MNCDGNIRIKRTVIGIWKVSTVKLPNGVYETAVKHWNEPKHKGYFRVLHHLTLSQAKIDHRIVVDLIRTLVRKITKHGHKRN